MIGSSRASRWLSLLLLLVTGCSSTLALDLQELAEIPPLPYRIAVVGGAFLPKDERARVGNIPTTTAGVRRIYSRTYPPDVVEPIPFSRIEDLLARGRAATSLLVPDLDDAAREAIALGDAAVLQELRRWAIDNSVDLLLVIEGLQEGPVRMHGVTGQWPVTSIAWLLVGLGMFIPDHRFESDVRLIASIRDVHTGEVVASNLVVSPGSMDLALVDRAGLLGIVTSILVPPTLVGNDTEKVVRNVREEGDRRLLLRLLARLKDTQTLEAVVGGLPMRLVLREVQDRRVRIELDAPQELRTLAVEVLDANGRAVAVDPDARAQLRSRLLGSGETVEGRLLYRATTESMPRGGFVRVLLQSVAGQRASSTIRISR